MQTTRLKNRCPDIAALIPVIGEQTFLAVHYLRFRDRVRGKELQITILPQITHHVIPPDLMHHLTKTLTEIQQAPPHVENCPLNKEALFILLRRPLTINPLTQERTGIRPQITLQHV